MARTELTVQEVNRTGLEPTYVAGDATNDHSFDNATQAVIVHVKNGGGAGITATFITSKTIDGLAVGDLAISIPAGEERFVGPFRNDLYGQVDSDNELDKAVFLDLDTAASVTLVALEIGDVNF